MKIEAILFDLDGVLTDTAEYHFQAWNALCKKLNLKFDRNMNEQLKGVSRQKSFEIILHENSKTEAFTQQEIERTLAEKNAIYVGLLQKLSPKDVLEGIPEFLKDIKRKNLKLAVASASKNAAYVLNRLELREYFDYVADAKTIKQPKPNPEIFTKCADELGVNYNACIGVEDSQAGIEAIKAAGMLAVGIHVLVKTVEPDIHYQATSELIYSELCKAVDLLR